MAYVRTGGFGQEAPMVPASIPGLPTTETNPWKTVVVVSLVGVALWWLLSEAMKPGPRPRVRT